MNKIWIVIIIWILSPLLSESQTIYYQYDEISRLIQVTYPDSNIITYTYDASGNRTSAQTQNTCITKSSPIISASGNLIFCVGDSVILTSTNSAKFLWSTGDTTQNIVVKESGKFIVTADYFYACSKTSDTVNVTVLLDSVPVPTVKIKNINDTIFFVSSLSPGYQWLKNDSTITGANNQNYAANDSGYYSVRAKSINGCLSDTSIKVIKPVLYSFIGDGNWDNPANWSDSILPITHLPYGEEIIINPVGTGVSVLNRSQTINDGARITVAQGKKLIIQSDLIIKGLLSSVTTLNITGLTSNSAIAGGNILSNGGLSVTESGICYAVTNNPTIEDNVLATGSGTGLFTVTLSDLKENTTYYVRAYAINSLGTSYGNTISFKTPIPQITDIDGNKYSVVDICNQTWTAKNLEVTHYRNGDTIPQVQDPATWSSLTTGAWCYYQNHTANGTIYGKLYNWYAVNDSRGLAPVGLHIPSAAEWTNLSNACLGGSSVAAGKMKTTGTLQAATGLWLGSTNTATNSSGFSGIPAGLCLANGSFANLNSSGFWWSSTQSNTPTASFWEVDQGSDELSNGNISKNIGFTVRCVKN